MMKSARLELPPIANEDGLPHDKAVWRDGRCDGPGHVQICVQYAGGVIARTYVSAVPDWAGVERWRFGWPPR